MLIRHITEADVPAVSALGNHVYPPGYYESDDTFKSKVLYPHAMCLLAEIDGALAGYVVSFPDIVGLPYPINTAFIPVLNPNCQYIHDLCIAPSFRTRGVATHLTKMILDRMAWDKCALTAILGSESFWARFGFATKYSVQYCGVDAKYMVYDRTRHDAVPAHHHRG